MKKKIDVLKNNGIEQNKLIEDIKTVNAKDISEVIDLIIKSKNTDYSNIDELLKSDNLKKALNFIVEEEQEEMTIEKRFVRSLNRKYPGSISNLIAKIYSLKEAGINNRQASFWTSKGFFKNIKEGRKWKKFSIADIAVYRLLIELKEYNISPKALKKIESEYLLCGVNMNEATRSCDNGQDNLVLSKFFVPNIVVFLVKALGYGLKFNIYLRVYKTADKDDIVFAIGTLFELENWIFRHKQDHEEHIIGVNIKKEDAERVAGCPYIQINLNELWEKFITEVVIRDEKAACLTADEYSAVRAIRFNPNADITIEMRESKIKKIISKKKMDYSKKINDEEIMTTLSKALLSAKVMDFYTKKRDGKIVSVETTNDCKILKNI